MSSSSCLSSRGGTATFVTKKYMTISEFWEWERRSRDTIDVKRCYIDIAGDLVAGILLSQIMYWFLPDKGGNPKLRVKDKEGVSCLAKNRDDWKKECRISARQYDRAIKILQEKGFIGVHNSMFNGKRTPLLNMYINNIIKAIEKLEEEPMTEDEK